MHIYDISLTISPELPVWPGDPKITIERIEKMEEGNPANVSRLDMSVHVGTHVDAPFHFLGDDTPTVEKIPLSRLTGRAYLCHLPDQVDLITAEVLRGIKIPKRVRRILFRTRNSTYWAKKEANFIREYVALSPDGAQYLVNRGVGLVGVDYLSVGPFPDGTLTHQILLKAGVIILEGLDLSQVKQGRYNLYCLPLKIGGADGAPARAILVGA